jgi:hypothetical protein
MCEKTFMVDTRMVDPGKFHEQVMLAVNVIINNEDVKVYCFDEKYAAEFKAAVAKELAAKGKMLHGQTP